MSGHKAWLSSVDSLAWYICTGFLAQVKATYFSLFCVPDLHLKIESVLGIRGHYMRKLHCYVASCSGLVDLIIKTVQITLNLTRELVKPNNQKWNPCIQTKNNIIQWSELILFQVCELLFCFTLWYMLWSFSWDIEDNMLSFFTSKMLYCWVGSA